MKSPLGEGPEFDRIRAIAAATGSGDRLGDDCAVIAHGSGELLASTDVSVEGVHFRRAWLSFEEIGWRAAASALSDLAAMGAEPSAVLVALAGPASAPAAESVAVMRGVGAAAEAAGAEVAGGDLSTASEWMITVTVLGRADRPVPRSGVRPGDGLWVTGALGGARAALDAWERGATPTDAARAAFAHPVPRIAAGRWLGAHGAHAMIDLSDGLAADVRHLAAASGVRIDITVDRVPTSGAAVEAALARGEEPARFAAEGGEDYELLVALPESFTDREVLAFERATGLALTRVGSALRGGGVHYLLRGERISLRGYDHFR